MSTVWARNAHNAVPKAVTLLRQEGVRRPSRGGETTECPWPVVTTLLNPRERVVFWPERDANPFFHAMEALWLLQGRDDVAWLVPFNQRMAEFSDDGARFHGSYGHRWRHAFGMDQIAVAIEMLRKDPESRRAVLQMWHASLDLGVKSLDLPCNDLVGLKIREDRLFATVFVRSHDIVWGMLGANCVQLSILQEFLADRIGVGVGPLTFVSDSFHAYTGRWEHLHNLPLAQPCPYALGEVTPYPLHADEPGWDGDLASLFRPLEQGGPPLASSYGTQFFRHVVAPMYEAHRAYRARDFIGAFDALSTCRASDWRRAGMEWLQRRPSYKGRQHDG